MQIYVRKRRRSSSAVTLLVTLLLGFAIGYTTCLAFRGKGSEDAAAPPAASQAAPNPADTAKAEAPSEPPETAPMVPPSEAPEEATAGTGATAETPANPSDVPVTEAAADAAPEAATPPAPTVEDWPARHLFITVKGKKLDENATKFLQEVKPGGVLLLSENIDSPEQTKALVAQIKQAVGLGEGVADLPLIAVDQEGGPINRLKVANAPSAKELGDAADLEKVRAVARGYAQACQAHGIALLFGPVMDVFEPGADPEMQARCFGRNADLVTAMGLAFADELTAGGVLPVVKHYPGLGAAKKDPSKSIAILDKSPKELARIMSPFMHAADTGVPGIMIGQIAVPAVNTDTPLLPATLSPVLLQQTLRGELRFKGGIISDDIGAGAVTKSMTVPEAAVKALAAGCDALTMLDSGPKRVRAICKAIEDALSSGALSRDKLVESQSRLDAWQAWLRKPERLKGELPPLPTIEEEEPAETAPEPAQPPEEEQSAKAPEGSKEIKYVVKPGDTLHRIATTNGVKADDIMAWNALNSTALKPGKELTLYVKGDAPEEKKTETPAPEAAPAETTSTEATPSEAPAPAGEQEKESKAEAKPEGAEGDQPSGDESQAAEPEEAPAKEAQEKPEAGADAGETTTYTLANGDTIGKLSARLKVPVKTLLELNGISDPTKLHVGQKIKVPKK